MSENPFDALARTMRALRSENGCPWDRAQTLTTLKPFLIEEAYEVIDAIDADDPAGHLEELGDLLFQVVFQSQIRTESDDFTFNDVAQTINDKMRRRHPHVFGTCTAEDEATVALNWDKLKQTERADKKDSSRFAGIPKSAPGLLKAQRLGEKASRFGLDWTTTANVIDKIKEELNEFESAHIAGDQNAMAAEFGDLLFTIVNLARHLEIDAENAISLANRKFEKRARVVETIVDESPTQTPESIDLLWHTAKQAHP